MFDRDAFPAEDGAERSFWAAKMPRPDTYILYDAVKGDSGSHRIAGINSRDISAHMGRLFSHDIDARKITVCRFNARIKRWIPLL